MHVARNLKIWLAWARLTHQDLAQICWISPSVLSRGLNREARGPGAWLVQRIAHATGVSPAILHEEEPGTRLYQVPAIGLPGSLLGVTWAPYVQAWFLLTYSPPEGTDPYWAKETEAQHWLPEEGANGDPRVVLERGNLFLLGSGLSRRTPVSTSEEGPFLFTP